MKARVTTKGKKTAKLGNKPSLKKIFLGHFRLVEHKHTGRLVHHRHTSHPTLFAILIVAGFVLYGCGKSVDAYTQTVTGTVSIGATVTGPAPTVGAVITSPIDGANLVNKTAIEVSGTCPAQTFITITNNGNLAGSTVCSDNDSFMIKISITLGQNILLARNYDNFNQAGPITPSVTLNVSEDTEQPGVVNPPTPVTPTLPENPSVVPGKDDSDCAKYNFGELPDDKVPHVSVVCIPRTFNRGVMQTMGILVWGGVPPYAVYVNWGDSSEGTLLNLPTAGYHKVSFSYAHVGSFKVNLSLKDKNNVESFVQAAVQVNGVSEEVPAVSGTVEKEWFEASVPVYLLALAVTVGFWLGDIFDQRFSLPYRRHAKRVT